MAANSLFAGAVQILCFIAYKGGEGTTAELAARSLKTNPVVVRRLLKSLEGQGLVTIRQGRYGGVALARSPRDITLKDVKAAVDGGAGLFALRERGNSRCPVNRAMEGLLSPVFAAAAMAASKSLAKTRLSDLVGQIA